jgi:two-component system response regulator (stage 0 sporulation protein A)
MSKIDQYMKELGHPENLSGTDYLRSAVRAYEQGMSLTKELYPAIAKAAGSTPARVERAMRHSIETAWVRGDLDAQRRYFGCTIDPQRGKPTVGEYVATMARICREN